MALPLMNILALLSATLVLAKIAGGVGDRFKISAVLCELLAGVFLAKLAPFVGINFDLLRMSELANSLSELGVIFLLFLVGLETDLNEMMKVGKDAFIAATAGVVAPFALAFLLLPLLVEQSSMVHTMFIAAALTATSVGITARVLQEKSMLNSISGRIILGAAVIDDVLGIIILAAVTDIARTGSVSVSDLLVLLGKVGGFAVGVFIFRKWLLAPVNRLLVPLEIPGTLLILLVSLCLWSAWVAEKLGLAGIVGAFAIGLALDDMHFKGYRARERKKIAEIIRPLSEFFTPIFFVMMGLKVELSGLSTWYGFRFALVLILAAIAGKLVCGFVVSGKAKKSGADPWFIGFGMIPRGEVGLIFATMGLSLNVLNPTDYAVVVAMVGITTIVAPILLAYRAQKLSASR